MKANPSRVWCKRSKELYAPEKRTTSRAVGALLDSMPRGDRWNNWAAITMTKRRPLLQGWKLYLVEILLAYPILFGMLWTLQTLKAKSFNSHWHYSYMDVSLKEIALFAGIAVVCIAVSIIYADIRKR